MKYTKKRLTLILPSVIIILYGILAFAGTTQHKTGQSSVDGSVIDYKLKTTKYTTNIAQATANWTALGKITFRETPWYAITDLYFYDTNRSDVSWDGEYVYTSVFPQDEIHLNSYYLDQPKYTDAMKTNVATHEVGHSLGIGDHYEDIYKASGSSPAVMFYASFSGSTYVRPYGIQAHDRSDYSSIYP